MLKTHVQDHFVAYDSRTKEPFEIMRWSNGDITVQPRLRIDKPAWIERGAYADKLWSSLCKHRWS